MVERDIKLRAPGEFAGQDFPRFLLPGEDVQSAVAGNPVIQVHDEIVLGKIVEAQRLSGDGRPCALPSAAPGLHARGASENLRVSEDGKPRLREGEAAGQRTEHACQLPGCGGFRGGKLTETGGFPFVGADDAHRPSVILPLRNLAEQVAAALIEKDDIPGGEIPGRVVAGEDFDFVSVRQHGIAVHADGGFRPCLAEGEKEGLRSEMIPHGGVLSFRSVRESKFASVEGFDGALGVGVVGRRDSVSSPNSSRRTGNAVCHG